MVVAGPDLDRGGAALQVVVQGVAGHALGAAGAHHVGAEPGEPRLVRGIEPAAAAHQGGGLDQRQLVVLQQHHHHAVVEHHPLGLRDVEARERGIAQVVGAGGLGRGGGGQGEDGGKEERRSGADHGWVLPCGASPGLLTSMATVRFSLRNASPATRRTSALVTLSSRSM